MFKQLLLRKSIEQIQTEAQHSGLKRTLGKWNLVTLGIGCIIGAGIFVMTGTAAASHAGPAIILSFVLAGIACAFAGLCYAELASVLPVSGSAYTYAYATLGEVFAWTMGWLLLLEYGISASAVAVGWSGYLNSFLLSMNVFVPPAFATALGEKILVNEALRAVYEAHGYTMIEVAEKGAKVLYLGNAAGDYVVGKFNALAFSGIMMVTALLVKGVSESAKVNNIIVFIKMAVIIAFIAIGVFYVNTENWVPFIPENTGPGEFGVDGIFRAASIIFFAYIGFEAVSTAAAEAKDPQKDMPFGILGSLLVCTILYMAVALVLTGVVKYTALNVADPMAVAVDAIGLGWFSIIIKVGAIAGLSSVMLVLCYGQTRVFYTMSRDGLIPSFFSHVHAKTQTPWINTLIVGTLVGATAAVVPIKKLGDMTSVGTLSAFIIVCVSVLYLHYKEPKLHRPFNTPFKPLFPLLGVLSCGYLALSIFFGFDNGVPVLTESGREMGRYMAIYLGVGALIYLFYGRIHSKMRAVKDGAFL
jgi:APA family basic amino acid/polyamine antiporter